MRKYLTILLSIVFVVGMLTGCGNSPEKNIIGSWDRTVGEETWSAPFSEMEFFDNGTYASDDANYNGNYSITDDRIMLSGILVSPLTFTFEATKDTLSFYEDGELIAEFEKK